jgi:2-keto-myo-inositol isomerase
MSLLACLNTSTIQPLALSRKIELIAKAGFRHVELWNNEIDDHLQTTGESLKDVHNRLADHGLQVEGIVAMMGWADATDDQLPGVLEECRRRAGQAAGVGSRSIVVSPPMGKVSPGHFKSRFELVKEVANHFHLKPYLEFLGFTEQYHTLDSVLDCARQYPLGEVPIVGDSFHLIRGGGSLEEILKLKPEELGIFHINDLPAVPAFSEQTDYDRVMPGDGVVDLQAAVRYIKQMGYSGAVSLELFNRTLWADDPESVLKRGFEQLTALLATPS